MHISKNGLNLIKEFEGCKLKAYRCPAGVLTIGYGTTNADKSIIGCEITDGMTISQELADSWLQRSIESKYEPKVSKYDNIYHWNQNQFDAMVSYAYNIGSIDKLVDKGNRSIKAISDDIPNHNKANGKVLVGLTRRRLKEKELFDKKVDDDMGIKEKDITICGHGSNTPSLKNMHDYFEARYNSLASNGKHKGIVSVKRLKSLDDKGRANFKTKYASIIGRNKYDQNLRDYCYKPYKDGHYYSDCSSSGCYTFKEIGHGCGNLNTAGIYNSNLFETVDVNIVNGHITNPEILKVGDALLFVGNDPSRPKQIGHVEYVYSMPTVEPTNKSGWVNEDGGWRFYLGDTGLPVKGDWYEWTSEKDNNKYWSYFLGDTGFAVVNDWFKYKDKWYFFNEDAVMLHDCWVTWKAKNYYLTSDGSMATDCYIKDPKQENWYWYVSSDGMYDYAMDTGKPNKDKILK